MSPTATLTETKGDLFASPDHSVLVHACNCRGAWGKGIAKRFRELYPTAYTTYRLHCQTHTPPPTTTTTASRNKNKTSPLLGTALLIPPLGDDLLRRHWIGCLFTRVEYRGRGKVLEVLEATRGAVRDLVRLVGVERMKGEGEGGMEIGEVVACRINEGCFGVEWGDTRRVLVEEGVRWRVVEFEGGSLGGRGRGRGGRVVEGKRGRGGRDGREGDGACVEKGVGVGDGLENDALRREGSVSSSMTVMTGTAMQDGGAVVAQRGKRRRFG